MEKMAKVKTHLVELTSRYGSGRPVKIRVPLEAEPPFQLSREENMRLRRKAKLITGDYFDDVDVGY
jgi:hypothetical protein